MKAQILILSLLFAMTITFQACDSRLHFNNIPLAKSQSNGEGYFGKPTPYDFLSVIEPCKDVGANGKALPNNEIFVFENGLVEVVRENCTDIIPRDLASGDYTLASNGTLTYENRTFASSLQQGDFDVLAASCPTGRAMLSNPVRLSLFSDPLNLLSASWWDTKGMTISLEGSLGSLPLYKVQRLEPNALENWRRIAQNPYLAAGETYVYSFYIRPDANEKAKFLSYIPNGQDLDIVFDLSSGAGTILKSDGAQVIETTARVFAGGLYISVYFKSLITMQVNMGLGAAGSVLGSSISTTAHQFEKVSNFCAP